MTRKTQLFLTVPVLAATALLASARAATAQVSSITANWNGTSVTAGEYVWFNAHISGLSGLTGAPATGWTIYFTNQTITVNDPSTVAGQTNPLVINAPNASLTYNPSASGATETYDASGWHTLVNALTASEYFIGGAAYLVPSSPSGIDLKSSTATWTGTFGIGWVGSADINWQFATAVYEPFSTDYATLNVTPINENGLHAGVPQTYIDGGVGCLNVGSSCLQGGAMGGAGSNWTGSNSGTAKLAATQTVPEPGTIVLLVSGLAGLVPLARRRRLI